MPQRPSAPSQDQPPSLQDQGAGVGVAATFPCVQCGAEVQYKPGTRALRCPYCSAENQIPIEDDGPLEEQDLEGALAGLEREQGTVEAIVTHCTSCGADATLAPNVTSQSCPFCGSAIVAEALSKRVIRPWGVLPFKIDHAAARATFRQWLASRWFAPNDLKRRATVEDTRGEAASGSGLAGVYLPHWTFDAKASTTYTGQRGDHYYVTVGSGKNRRTERRTRWSWRSGRVRNAFDDVLICASTSLPPRFAQRESSWDLKAMARFEPSYLAGFRAESYTIGLREGFAAGRERMLADIRETIRRDIGGDVQRIHEMHPVFSDLTFKLVLLPLWISAYRYHGKTYRFVVNARTGEVRGERPYSAIKIALAVLAGLLVAGVIAFFASQK